MIRFELQSLGMIADRKNNFKSIEWEILLVMREFIVTSKKNNNRTVLRKDRSRWEIVQDLLNVTKEENKAKKTRIMQRAYLDWRNFHRYFDFLLEEGFIANCDSNSYELTEKGEELIKRLNQVDEMLSKKV